MNSHPYLRTSTSILLSSHYTLLKGWAHDLQKHQRVLMHCQFGTCPHFCYIPTAAIAPMAWSTPAECREQSTASQSRSSCWLLEAHHCLESCGWIHLCLQFSWLACKHLGALFTPAGMSQITAHSTEQRALSQPQHLQYLIPCQLQLLKAELQK